MGCADWVPVDSPGSRAGIHTGDILEAINGEPTLRLASQVRAMFSNGLWCNHAASYSILVHNGRRRGLARMQSHFRSRCGWNWRLSTYQGSRLIALVYLFIGLYVLLRRWTAPKSMHFYLFCLVSFVLYAFRPTFEPGMFDRVIYWGNLLAMLLQPALFLHFAVSFWDRREPM